MDQFRALMSASRRNETAVPGMTKPAERILYGTERPDGTTPFWRMATIWSAAAGKAAVEVPIDGLGVLDQVVWFGGPNDVKPTVRRIAAHARDIFNADLSYPIIMTRSGDVLDGAHRLARAYIEGRKTIGAFVIDDWPVPDGVVPSGRV
jgi:hypothetical protein